MTVRVITLALIAFALHFGWEMTQAKWFATMNELPFWTATAWCMRAALWDVAIAAAAYLAAAVAARNASWPRSPRALAIAVYFAVGLAITVATEHWALAAGRWRYEAAMPTVGGIGVTPLLQWIVVPAITLAAARLVMSLRRSRR
ncbi:MAG: hypothetical protein AABO58_06035 [Acidobacteriota bacterium]